MSGAPPLPSFYSVNPVASRLGELGPVPAAELAGRRWDAAIVGAGHNGLAAAAYLARAGKSVVVLEGRQRVGGACTLERPFADRGFVISPCAYLAGLLDPLVIGELGLRERGVEMMLADPWLFVPIGEREAVTEWSSRKRTAESLRAIGVSDHDIAGLRAYEEQFDLIRRLLRRGERDSWVGESPTRAEIEAMLGGDPELISIVFEDSIAAVIERHISDQRLRDALAPQGLIGTWAGPRDPGTAMVHLMHRMGEIAGRGGIWGYVRGGIGMVSFALADAALEAGAVVSCETPVERILPGEGIELSDGTIVAAEAVLCNADPKILLGLLGDGIAPPAYERRLREWQTRSPTFKVNMALSALPSWRAAEPGAGAGHSRPDDRTWPARGTVNITPGIDACQEAFAACERGELAIGYIELYSQTASDPTPAPAGMHLMSGFCQYAPAGEHWTPDLRERAGREVIAAIEAHAPGFEQHLIEIEVLGPAEIEQRIGLTGGQIFQGDCLPEQMWEHRLASRTPVEGLYLCGAATHPGGSVIGLNGRNAAMAALADS